MKPNYRVESKPCYSTENKLAVFYFELINEILTIPVVDVELYKHDGLVGFWKIKKFKV